MCTMMGCGGTDPDSDAAAAAAAAAATATTATPAAAGRSKAHSDTTAAAVVIGVVLLVGVVGGVIVQRSKMSGNGRGQLSNVENAHINQMYEEVVLQAPVGAPTRPLVNPGDASAC